MKTSICISLLLLFFGQTLFAASVEGQGTVTLGKKSSANCSGFGVCQMTSAQSSSPKGEMNCKFKFDSDSRTFIIAIAQTEIMAKNAAKLQYFQDKTNVTIDEDFVLPQEILSLLQIAGSASIKKGNYALTLVNGVYNIVMTL